MNQFIKLKTEATGYPSWVITEEHKRYYVDQYLERERIELDPSEIYPNPGKRSLAKLILNSFWGKFGQRSNLEKVKYFNNNYEDLAEYFNCVNDYSLDIKKLSLLHEHMVSLTYSTKEDFLIELPHVSVIIAIYVTAQARLKLYSYLEQLNTNILYYDTDSIIFVDSSAVEIPPCGDYVGDLTDELAQYGVGSYIKEFISGGPKQYGIKIWSTDKQDYLTIVKLRGFTINSNTADVLSFDNIKQLVHDFALENQNWSLITNLDRIERTQTRAVVTRKEAPKKYRIVYEKRYLGENFLTFPFGFDHSEQREIESSILS